MREARLTPATTPEPASVVLGATGLPGLAAQVPPGGWLPPQSTVRAPERASAGTPPFRSIEGPARRRFVVPYDGSRSRTAQPSVAAAAASSFLRQ
jgi:hypothetical protein